jgi:tricorn protease
VEPDIVVDNLPHATWRGEDRQLARGVEVLLQHLADDPVVQPPTQPFPPLGESAEDIR